MCFVWGDASALDSVDSVLARVQCVNCRIVLRLVNSGPVQLDVTLTVSTMCVRSGVCHSNEAYHSVRLNLKPQCTLQTRAGWIPTLVYIKSTASERGTESGTWTIVVHHTTSSRTTNVFVATPGMPTPDVAQSKGVRSAACEAVCGRPWSRRRCGTARSWVRCSAGRRHSAQWVYGGAASCQQWRRLPARSHDAPAVLHHRRRHGNDASKRPQQRRANGRLRPGWQGRTRHRHGGASYHRRQSDGATAVAVAGSSTPCTRRRALPDVRPAKGTSCTVRRVTGRLAGGPVRRRRRVLVAVCMNVPACVGWG